MWLYYTHILFSLLSLRKTTSPIKITCSFLKYSLILTHSEHSENKMTVKLTRSTVADERRVHDELRVTCHGCHKPHSQLLCEHSICLTRICCDLGSLLRLVMCCVQ